MNSAHNNFGSNNIEQMLALYCAQEGLFIRYSRTQAASLLPVFKASLQKDP